jgi:hypothetical protein
MVFRENSLVYEFGHLLWELISGQQQCKPREGLSLVLFLDSTMHLFCTNNCPTVSHLMHWGIIVPLDPFQASIL